MDGREVLIGRGRGEGEGEGEGERRGRGEGAERLSVVEEGRLERQGMMARWKKR